MGADHACPLTAESSWRLAPPELAYGRLAESAPRRFRLGDKGASAQGVELPVGQIVRQMLQRSWHAVQTDRTFRTTVIVNAPFRHLAIDRQRVSSFGALETPSDF